MQKLLAICVTIACVVLLVFGCNTRSSPTPPTSGARRFSTLQAINIGGGVTGVAPAPTS